MEEVTMVVMCLSVCALSLILHWIINGVSALREIRDELRKTRMERMDK